jgi:hypothetical protein
MATRDAATERQEIIQTVGALSDDAIGKLAPYVSFLRHEDKAPDAGARKGRKTRTGKARDPNDQWILDVLLGDIGE